MTRRLHREGSTIVWAARAIAWERVPESRCSLQWLSRRYRRVGASTIDSGPQDFVGVFLGIVGGVVRILTAIPRLGWFWLRECRIDAAATRRLFRGVGFLEAATIGAHAEYAVNSSRGVAHSVES